MSNCNSNIKTHTDFVSYIGQALSCIPLLDGQNVTLALENIDAVLSDENITDMILDELTNNPTFNDEFITYLSSCIRPTTTTSTSSTSTSTSTSTTTTTTTIALPNDYILMNDNSVPPSKIYYYNPSTQVSTLLEFVNYICSPEIGTALSSGEGLPNVIHLYDQSKMYETSITLNPFSGSFNREIRYPDNLPVLPSAIFTMDNDLIYTFDESTDPVKLIVLNISEADSVRYEVFDIEPNRRIVGDFFITNVVDAQKMILLNKTVINNVTTFYISQYAFPVGTLELDINLSSQGIKDPSGMFEYNSGIYIIANNPYNQSIKSVYSINTSNPYDVQFVNDLTNYVHGTAQPIQSLITNFNL